MGGLSKKAFQIEALRKQGQRQFLVLDAGNLLFPRSSLPPGDSRETIAAAGILEAYERMGYDAVAVGPLDVSAGLEFLRQPDHAGFPWVSANLLNRDNSPVFKPFVIKQAGRQKIGIIGLTQQPPSLPADVHLAVWQEVLPRLMQKLAQECDHILLLSNLPARENIEIAQAYSSLAVVISADVKLGNLSPDLTNSTLITQTTTQGKYLGMLSIEWGNSGQWKIGFAKQREALEGKIAAIDHRIRLLETQSDVGRDFTQELEQARTERQNLSQQLATARQAADAEKNNTVTASTFTSRFIALENSSPDAPEITRIVTGIKQRIRSLDHPPRQ